jgi:hypothetical protein
MATIGTKATYLDFASRMDPDNRISAVIELLTKTNEILGDMFVKEGNLPTGHKSTIRTGLPGVTWRLLNYGVQPTKSLTSQVTDTVGMLEAYAQVDKDLAELNGNTAAWRTSEDSAFLEAMNQEMATTLFYGNQNTNPERFTGLMPRYPQFGAYNKAITAYNCVAAHAGANAVQTSMWLVVWGDQTVHGLFPKGSTSAGFSQEDKGQQTLTDDQTPAGLFEGYRTHYQWKLGLTVKDWRYAVRICNIDTVLMSTTVVDVVTAMTKAYYRIPSFGMGRAVFYCNSFVAEWLTIKAMAKTNTALTYREGAGEDAKPVTSFMGIPIKRVDALLNTEALVLTI